MSRILVGTSSWTDKTLIDCGRFYPPSATTPEDRLRFYASQFPIVEIDSSYYGIPNVENAQRWVERTPPGFVFNIKTYRLFTRHQTPVASLGKDIRAALGSREARRTSMTRTCRTDLATELWRQFRAVLDVLREGGKLGAVHMQFAPWVTFHPENFDYIEHCRAMLAGFTVAVEFRNRTWFDTDKHTARTLRIRARQRPRQRGGRRAARHSQHHSLGMGGDQSGGLRRSSAWSQPWDVEPERAQGLVAAFRLRLQRGRTAADRGRRARKSHGASTRRTCSSTTTIRTRASAERRQ